MYPFLVSLSNVSLLGFWVVILFLFILTVGLIYELGKGALEYAQHSTSSSSNPSQNSPPRPRHLSLVRVGVRRYSTASRCGSPSLEPQFITGLVDAEGYFVISISPSRAYRVGWILQGLLSLQLHVNEIALLNQIQGSFGAGNINLHPNRDVATWVVYSPYVNFWIESSRTLKSTPYSPKSALTMFYGNKLSSSWVKKPI